LRQGVRIANDAATIAVFPESKLLEIAKVKQELCLALRPDGSFGMPAADRSTPIASVELVLATDLIRVLGRQDRRPRRTLAE
jgi:hypothetical protein